MDYFSALSEEHQAFLKGSVFPIGRLNGCISRLQEGIEEDIKFFKYAVYCAESVKEADDPTIKEIIHLIYPFLGLHNERYKLAELLLFAWGLSACFSDRSCENINLREYAESQDFIDDIEEYKKESGDYFLDNAGLSIYWLKDVEKQGLIIHDLEPYIKVWDSYLDDEECDDEGLFVSAGKKELNIVSAKPPTATCSPQIKAPKKTETQERDDDLRKQARILWNEGGYRSGKSIAVQLEARGKWGISWQHIDDIIRGTVRELRVGTTK